MGLFSRKKPADRERSDYNDQPLRRYPGTVNGRRVEVYSSWKPGDPNR